ncbi:MAG: cobalt transporter CbiM [Methanobacterium sp.]|uniref:cobalt transporter CbiM n=1 Tax=Methanobacterium sp. TaxID=2164 RepID=UPI003D658FEA|nr:cobalt transporter CbiM [Methanobacterium sp.]
MHIPDGIIPLWQCVIYILIALIVGFYALKWARNNLDERNVPLIAILAAGIFIIQLFNFPIFAGSSGHVVGAVLVAILLGSPFAGFLILTVVLIVQAIALGDGGITALGANILNMAIISSFVGFYSYKCLRRFNELAAIFLAGWIAVVTTSIITAFELAIAGVFPLIPGILLMGGLHAIIGIGEGLITMIAVVAIRSVRPDLSIEGAGTHE